MIQLQEYLANSINEASVVLSNDNKKQMDDLFNKIKSELKHLESASKSEFDEFNIKAVGTNVIGIYRLHCEDNIEEFVKELDKFKKNSGKWKYLGVKGSSIGRGASRYDETFELVDGDVTYTLTFPERYDKMDYILVELYIKCPIMVQAEDLKFTPNTSDKSKDIAGRVINVGDSVAYCSRSVSGNNPMPVGVVIEATPKQIKIYDKINDNIVLVPGFKCCIINL